MEVIELYKVNKLYSLGKLKYECLLLSLDVLY